MSRQTNQTEVQTLDPKLWNILGREGGTEIVKCKACGTILGWEEALLHDCPELQEEHQEQQEG